MRTLIFALIPSLLLGCGDDTTTTVSASGSTSASDPTTDPSGDPTGDPSTSVDPTNATSTTTGESATDSAATVTVTTQPTQTDPTTEDVTTVAPSTSGTTEFETAGTVDPSDGTTTTGDTEGTGGSSTGGPVVGCGMDGPEIEASLAHLGEPPPPCGTLEFSGQNQADSPGPVYQLDGCPCGANCLKPDPWTFTIDAPLDWQPGKIPACPHIVVQRQMGKAGCELVGVSIWDAQADNAPAVYHAGSLLGPIDAAAAELKTEAIVAEECDCDNCCNSPVRWDLKFTALGKSLTLAEGDDGQLVGDKATYTVKNFQSHLSGICDDAPAVDWVMKRVLKP